MDPFLALHKWMTRPIFDLSKRHRSISIRDQILRGLMIGSKLDQFLNDEPYSELKCILVVGAGACGVTSAIELVERGHEVDLIDSYETFFRLQATSGSRWIDPAQYDFPLDHWRVARFPIGQPYEPDRDVPLQFRANRASEITKAWMSNLRELQPHLTDLRFLPQTSLFDTRSMKVIYDPLKNVSGISLRLFDMKTGKEIEQPHRYRAVVFAGGFGDEWTEFPIEGKDDAWHHTFPFWSDDDMEFMSPEDQVVISGSGDGALQDLIRVATGLRSARAVVDRIRQFLSGEELGWIHGLEHRIERTLSWQNDRDPSMDKFVGHLQSEIQQIVIQILNSHPDVGEIIEQLNQSNPQRIHLICRQPFFTCHYALNRFVALLIINALPRNIDVHWRSSLHSIHWINESPIPDELADDPEHLEHFQRLERADLCRRYQWQVVVANPDHQQILLRPVDLVVARHGLRDHKIYDAQSEELIVAPNPEPPILLPPN